MNYTLDDFDRLTKAVEAQGGEHLDSVCEDRVYTFSGPHNVQFSFIAHEGSAQFAIPYESAMVGNAHSGKQTVVVCAVEDEMGKWPRFAKR